MSKGCGPARVQGVMGKKWVNYTGKKKCLAGGSFPEWSVFKKPRLLLNLAILLWSSQKALWSQRQNWWLRDCGYLTNKRLKKVNTAQYAGWDQQERRVFKSLLNVWDSLLLFGCLWRVSTENSRRLLLYWRDKNAVLQEGESSLMGLQITSYHGSCSHKSCGGGVREK